MTNVLLGEDIYVLRPNLVLGENLLGNAREGVLPGE